MKQKLLFFLMLLFPMLANASSKTINVATPGTLPSLITAAERYQIEELTLTGNLNGTDFRVIREMAGNDYLGQATAGSLKILDLSGANIVAGGENYLETNEIRHSSGSTIGTGGSYSTANNNLGSYIFAGCDKLESILLPNSITSQYSLHQKEVMPSLRALHLFLVVILLLYPKA